MNRVMFVLGVGALAAALGTPGALMAADRWEFNDNGPWQPGFTDNEITPGSVQEHDMEGADEDWIALSQRPYSSYEVRLDGMSDGLTLTTGTGDILAVDLVESDGTLVATGYAMNPVALDRRVTFRNDTATANNDQQMRISSAACSPGCSAAGSGYTIRLFDTTYNVSRFNNAGTQTTVVILQNSLSQSVIGSLHFFNPAGTHLASHNVSIAAHGTAVVNTPVAVPAVAGLAGSMILTNDGGYGGLSGKAIALEPSTGFTFDTLMTPRPQ